MKDIDYDHHRPLMRLETGDRAIIKIRHNGLEKPEHKAKYRHISDGTYEAIVVSPYKLCCLEHPALSGRYCYWIGNKWGCGGLIYADELGQ